MFSVSEQIELAGALADSVADWVYETDTLYFNAEQLEFYESFFQRSLKLIESDPNCELSKALRYDGPIYRIQKHPISKESDHTLLSWNSGNALFYKYEKDIDSVVLLASRTTLDNIGINLKGLEEFLNQHHDSLIKHVSSKIEGQIEDHIDCDQLDFENKSEIICRLQKPYIMFHSLDAYIRDVNHKGNPRQ